jgi:hypothetical protein
MNLPIAIILGIVEVGLIILLFVMQNLKDEENWNQN